MQPLASPTPRGAGRLPGGSARDALRVGRGGLHTLRAVHGSPTTRTAGSARRRRSSPASWPPSREVARSTGTASCVPAPCPPCSRCSTPRSRSTRGSASPRRHRPGWHEDWVGHVGEERGVATEMFFRPSDGLGFVLLMNGDGGSNRGPVSALEAAIIRFGRASGRAEVRARDRSSDASNGAQAERPRRPRRRRSRDPGAGAAIAPQGLAGAPPRREEDPVHQAIASVEEEDTLTLPVDLPFGPTAYGETDAGPGARDQRGRFAVLPHLGPLHGGRRDGRRRRGRGRLAHGDRAGPARGRRRGDHLALGRDLNGPESGPRRFIAGIHRANRNIHAMAQRGSRGRRAWAPPSPASCCWRGAP